MKKCRWCGKEYPDDARVCALDQEPLTSAGAPTEPQPATPLQEKGLAGVWAGGAVYKHAAALLKAGKSREDIHADLRARGLDEPGASEVVRMIFVMRKAREEAARQNMLYGVFWCIGGVAVTASTYFAAISSQGGGIYVVAWGAVIFGAIQFFRGLAQSTGSG